MLTDSDELGNDKTFTSFLDVIGHRGQDGVDVGDGRSRSGRLKRTKVELLDDWGVLCDDVLAPFKIQRAAD